MGHVTVVGGCRAKVPVTGILASSLAVGTTVKLMEGGTAVEYLVVNQGIPENSSLYDASCDGTWLLRKDIHSNRVWNANNVNTYANSDINTWLNEEFFNSLGEIEKKAVKQVKIPYCVGNGQSTVNSGTNGLSVKAFLLGGYEIGWTISDKTVLPQDGAKLSHFESGTGASANDKRLAFLNGSLASWWLRDSGTTDPNNVWGVNGLNGKHVFNAAELSYGARPALILPSNAVFDETTILLKGVA